MLNGFTYRTVLPGNIFNDNHQNAPIGVNKPEIAIQLFQYEWRIKKVIEASSSKKTIWFIFSVSNLMKKNWADLLIRSGSWCWAVSQFPNIKPSLIFYTYGIGRYVLHRNCDDLFRTTVTRGSNCMTSAMIHTVKIRTNSFGTRSS